MNAPSQIDSKNGLDKAISGHSTVSDQVGTPHAYTQGLRGPTAQAHSPGRVAPRPHWGDTGATLGRLAGRSRSMTSPQQPLALRGTPWSPCGSVSKASRPVPRARE